MKGLKFILLFVAFALTRSLCLAQTANSVEHSFEGLYISYRLHSSYADSVLNELFDYLILSFPKDYFFILIRDGFYEDNRSQKRFCIYKSEYKLDFDSISDLSLDGNNNRMLYLAQISNRFFKFGEDHKVPVIFESDEYFGYRDESPFRVLLGLNCFTSFSFEIKSTDNPYFTGLATAWEFRYENGEKELWLNSWGREKHMLPNPYEEYHKMRQVEDSLRRDSLRQDSLRKSLTE